MTETTATKSKTNSLLTVRNITKIAILAAVSTVLMFIEFPLPIAPSFYKLDLSEVSVLMGAFAMGPAAGAVIEGLKVLLHILLKGSTTMGVGDFANFCIGCAFVVPAAIIYRKHKTKKQAVIGLICGTLLMALAGVVFNYYVAIPAYVKLAGYPMDVILGMGAAINPNAGNLLGLCLICVLPFNIIKGVLVSVITVLLYKHISPLLHK